MTHLNGDLFKAKSADEEGVNFIGSQNSWMTDSMPFLHIYKDTALFDTLHTMGKLVT